MAFRTPAFAKPTARQAVLEADRKAAERERQKAELKRARLEAMYQSHPISSADYKRDQDEYQSAIAKYHSVLNGTPSTNE